MFEVSRFLLRSAVLGIADRTVTLPVVRWTWTGLSDNKFSSVLSEFRPTDPESVREMMAGRYLLAFKLVDTDGISPFAVDIKHGEWRRYLHGFSWLRHFREVRDEGERRFARTLALDWIGREGVFRRDSWAPALCAQRVMNWLRHFNLLVESATPDQGAAIARSLRTQIQSLKLRGPLATRPVDALMAAIALVAVALCDDSREAELDTRMRRLQHLLHRQIDPDGLHRSRSAKVQLELLVELVTLRQSLQRQQHDHARQLGPVVDSMHKALDALTPGTGEPAFFNGSGQLPHDLLIAVQAQGGVRRRETGALGGYGFLVCGASDVVADSGLVPGLPFADEAHASALAFEFSHGTHLVFGNCGPAPAQLPDSGLLFREGIAHSAPTINALSAARLSSSGILGGRLRPRETETIIELDAADQTMVLRTQGFVSRFGAVLERRITLLSGGTTLVGQDRVIGSGRRLSGVTNVRFHLAPGAGVRRDPKEDLLRIKLANGSVWTFLWEGAEMRLEDSVRQSAYFGFHRTRQIVLEAGVEDGHEIAWIFTLDQNH